MASTSQQSHEQDLVDDFNKVKVTILASEWGSSNGGIDTLSKELAVQLAKFPESEITTFLLRCSEEDKKEALRKNVKIVKATRCPGFDESVWLNYPPEDLEMDVVVGYGVELGRHAQVLKKSKNCKWVQVVHTDPEENEMFKSYCNETAEGQGSDNVEVELCEMADLVVGVGPKLCEAFRSHLRSCQKEQSVVELTPGVFDEFVTIKQSHHGGKHCKVLVFGCGGEEDFSLKGCDIAGKAVSALPETRLVFAGASGGMHGKTAEKLKGCGVAARYLRVRGCVQNRGDLKRLFQEVDLLLMPSRVEGFGLTGLEALSAGIPVLVSKNSGFGEALSEVPFGSSFVVDSEDPQVWAAAIENLWKKDRQVRLEEAKALRTRYEEKHSWTKQTRNLLDKMINMAYGASVVTSATDLQKRVLGTKRSAECPQDVRSVVIEAALKCLKSGQGDVQRGLTQAEAEKQGSASSQISYEIANCEADIAFFAHRHDQDTRQWLFDDFDKWFDDPGDSKAYVLLGDAGVGKSVMAGALAQRRKLAGHLGAAYFCRHNDRTRNDPRNLIGTIASQLCDCNSQYDIIIGGKDGVKVMLANPNLGVLELCTKLIEEPLSKCRPSEQRKLVIIDALDETEYKSREDFLCLLKERFPRLPEGLVFFITSRPEDMVQTSLKRYNPCVRICAGKGEKNSFYQEHEQDIQRFLVNNVNFSRFGFSAEDVAKKCNGLFLYAFYIAQELNDCIHLGKAHHRAIFFPPDIEEFFRTNLQRVYDKVGAGLYRKLLGCILCAPSPLPVSFISYVIHRENSNIDEQKIIDAVSQFLVLEETATFLHYLIPRWLTNKRKARKLYIDDEWALDYFIEVLYEIFSSVDELRPKDAKLLCDLHECLSKTRKKKRTH